MTLTTTDCSITHNSHNNNNDQPVYSLSNGGYDGSLFDEKETTSQLQVRGDRHGLNKPTNAAHIVINTPVSRIQKVLVLMASFYSLCICFGIAFNMSVLNNEWLEYFQKTKAETSLIQSTTMAMLNLGGFGSGLAVAKIGPRKVGIVGGCLSALGLCLSFLTTDIPYLVITIGVITGQGFALILNSSFTSLTQHFEGKAIMMALSFASLGTGVGAMCIPLLLQFCIDNFGWRGSILIMGGLALNLPVCGMTYAEVKSRKSGTPSTQKSLINITECLKVLMTNGLFVWFVVGMAMVTSVLNIVSIFLIDYLQSRGMTREEAVNVYFIMTTTAAVFRLVPGILKQIPGVSVTVFPVIFASIGCVALALLPLFKTRLTLIFVACVYGCSLGGVVTVNSIVVLKLINREHYSTAIGINGALSGLSSIAAGPIAGYLRDITGNYSLTFHSASVTFGISSIIFAGIFIYRITFKKYKKETKQTPTTYNELEIVIKGPDYTPVFVDGFNFA